MRALQVIAVEKDDTLIERLREEFAQVRSFRLKSGFSPSFLSPAGGVAHYRLPCPPLALP
jgi:hypothetical protein